MPPIHDRIVAPPKRMILRIAVAIGFVLAAYLYVTHVMARERARAVAADKILAMVRDDRAAAALADGVAALRTFGGSRELSRATWAALMAGGGRHGGKTLLRRTFAYSPHNSAYALMFSTDSRFLAAIDGNTITIWNVENGSHVLTAEAGDRFIGYWRIGARHFGLLASYQYYDLVNSVIALPEGFRYAQPSKDSLTGVAPGGDWAYRVPDKEPARTDYPIKLVNLHTGEKREIDVDYTGVGDVTVNVDATRVANTVTHRDYGAIALWNARLRARLGETSSCAGQRLYFSHAQNALISSRQAFPGSRNTAGSICFADADTAATLFAIPTEPGLAEVADDPKGVWFAVQTANAIKLYRGLNSPVLSTIAEKELSPAPATSH